MRLLPALAVCVALVAGCASPRIPDECEGVASCAVCPDGSVPPCGDVAVPHVDAAAVLDDLYAFAAAYPYRQSGNAMHASARDDLEASFQAAGLGTFRHAFGAEAPGTGAFEGQNVLGVRWGSDRAHWIVVGAHYDVTEDAVFGCYDDGSGTILVRQLAAAFASANTTRTIAFVAFDQEERGLVGSTAFLDAVEDGSLGALVGEPNVTVDGMVDLDMVGITWPHPAPLVVWQNSPTLEAWVQELAGATGMPDAKLSFREPRSGVSDGAAFIGRGIATAYLWSNWDEMYLPDGTPVPFVTGYVGSYPFWHHADTCEGMEALAGGRATLEAGFQTVLDIVAPLVSRMAGPDFRPDGFA